MTLQWLTNCSGVDDVALDLPWISRRLWTFLGPRLGDDVYMRRVQLAGGEENNGIELWRKIFMTYEGGAEQVALGGLRRFHRFPPCPPKDELGHYLGEWSYLRTRFGSNIPDSSLWTMSMSIPPEDVQKDVRDRKHLLPSTQHVLDHVQDTHRSNLHGRLKTRFLEQGPRNAINSCSAH